ncbi:MAG: putative sarcosine oxidase subunit beta [Chloroflexi bacterium]|nr:putative sarcosine oxidase subunit beta [Chloroflexota bacterium]
MASYDAVIIGGGNLGLWTAHQLAKRGMKRIAVLERYWLAFGATTRSAGMVRQQGGSETAIKLGKWSRNLYISLADELGLDSGFIETGYFVIAETKQEKAGFLELVKLRQQCGVENEWVDAAEARKLLPFFNWDTFLGGTYTANDGYVHPPIIGRNITFAALKTGAVAAFEYCPAESIERHGSGYKVRTPKGDFESDRVIDAGGPRGARKVGAMLDIEVPVSAARHEVVTYPVLNGDFPARWPMFFVLGKGYYVRPEEQGALLGLSNPDEKVDRSERFQIGFDWNYFESMRPQLEAEFPAIKGQPICRSWAGSIDFTPDHLPIIDQPLPGFYVLAAGGHGMMWGPGLGMKMAELIDTGTVSDLPENEISLARFSQNLERHDLIALPFPTD